MNVLFLLKYPDHFYKSLCAENNNHSVLRKISSCKMVWRIMVVLRF